MLLDDFSASGTSYYRLKSDGSGSGKIATFHRAISDPAETLSQIVYPTGTEVIVLLYMATEVANKHLREHLTPLGTESGVTYHVEVVQELSESVRIRPVAGRRSKT